MFVLSSPEYWGGGSLALVPSLIKVARSLGANIVDTCKYECVYVYVRVTQSTSRLIK